MNAYDATRQAARFWPQDKLDERIVGVERERAGPEWSWVLAALYQEQALRCRARATCASLTYPRPCFLHTPHACDSCRSASAEAGTHLLAAPEQVRAVELALQAAGAAWAMAAPERPVDSTALLAMVERICGERGR